MRGQIIGTDGSCIVPPNAAVTGRSEQREPRTDEDPAFHHGTLFLLHTSEECLDFAVVSMVAADRNPTSAESRDGRGRFRDRPRRGGVTPLYRTTRDVDRSTGFAKPERNTFAHPSAATRHDSNLSL